MDERKENIGVQSTDESCCCAQGDCGGTPAERVEFLVDDTHKYTTVTSDGYIGSGGAHHRYAILRKEDKAAMNFICFQDGPIKEVGINGIMDENLLAILIDRLKGFQTGSYATKENAMALNYLNQALDWLKARTKSREDRGVEGTHQV